MRATSPTRVSNMTLYDSARSLLQIVLVTPGCTSVQQACSKSSHHHHNKRVVLVSTAKQTPAVTKLRSSKTCLCKQTGITTEMYSSSLTVGARHAPCAALQPCPDAFYKRVCEHDQCTCCIRSESTMANNSTPSCRPRPTRGLKLITIKSLEPHLAIEPGVITCHVLHRKVYHLERHLAPC